MIVNTFKVVSLEAKFCFSEEILQCAKTQLIFACKSGVKLINQHIFRSVTRWNLRRPSFSVLIANWQAIKPHIIPNGENVLRKLAKT